MPNDISMIKLEDFITEVLGQIIKGVKNADAVAAEHEAIINPPAYRSTQGYLYHDVDHNIGNSIEEIEFDIAITAVEKSEGKAGAGIFVSVIGLGAQTKEGLENSTISRIKFSVPIKLPSFQR